MKSNLKTVCLTAAISLISLFGGCAPPVEDEWLITFEPFRQPLISPLTAATSIEKRPLDCIVLGNGPNVTLFIAAIHGNEKAGTPLASALAEYLKQNPSLLQGKKVIIVPLANPDGYAKNKRTNARGIDINRNFAAPNYIPNYANGSKPLSEPETRYLRSLILTHNPDKIVSIHQPLNCIDYDGPASQLANLMARNTNLPVKKIGAQPGSLGSYASQILQKPIITLELPPGAENLTRLLLWQKYGRCLLAAIDYSTTAK